MAISMAFSPARSLPGAGGLDRPSLLGKLAGRGLATKWHDRTPGARHRNGNAENADVRYAQFGRATRISTPSQEGRLLRRRRPPRIRRSAPGRGLRTNASPAG